MKARRELFNAKDWIFIIFITIIKHIDGDNKGIFL